uniref:Uncharacterized protein n=1 Tax=Pithovirus LCPAC304 TaxID=2506594 RepID=A0A481Z9R8_9VIRU|nr:MAG: hypothetical protein LCPAC304_02510 [Pithovirus LCPAC304]
MSTLMVKGIMVFIFTVAVFTKVKREIPMGGIEEVTGIIAVADVAGFVAHF